MLRSDLERGHGTHPKSPSLRAGLFWSVVPPIGLTQMLQMRLEWMA